MRWSIKWRLATRRTLPQQLGQILNNGPIRLGRTTVPVTVWPVHRIMTVELSDQTYTYRAHRSIPSVEA